MSSITSILPKLIHKHLTSGTPVQVGNYVLVYRSAGQRMPVIEVGETNWDVASKTGLFQTKVPSSATPHLDTLWGFVSPSLADVSLPDLLTHYLHLNSTWRVLVDRAIPSVINLDNSPLLRSGSVVALLPSGG